MIEAGHVGRFFRKGESMESSITVTSAGAVSYSGPDAVNLYRARLLASSLRLYAKTGIIPTRGVTATAMLRMASEYTGKAYKRGQYDAAAADVTAWANTMQAALPITRDGVEE